MCPSCNLFKNLRYYVSNPQTNRVKFRFINNLGGDKVFVTIYDTYIFNFSMRGPRVLSVGLSPLCPCV